MCTARVQQMKGLDVAPLRIPCFPGATVVASVGKESRGPVVRQRLL